MNMHGRRLGRGLGGLIQSTVSEATPEEAKSADSLPVSEIRANPFQPRRHFDPAALDDLKSSIREHGVLQPIVVRRGAVGFEVVAGERRLRASRDLGLTRIPAVIRDVDDAGMQTLALVENIQREDLNPIEKARALKAMMGSLNLTQEAVAARVGKDRVTIANLIRILELPEEVRTWIEEGKLSAGQARTILQVQGDPKRLQLARLAVERDLSVRDLERLARLSGGGGGKKGSRAAKDPFVADLEDRIRRALSAKVRVVAKRQGGVIEIEYADATELDALLQRMGAA
jgi:ParB family chromosome partitioning protein